MKECHERPRIILVSRCFVLEDGHLLLIERATANRHHPGLWECPGGKLDHEQDLLQAQKREVMEETGLLVEPVWLNVFADGYVIGDGDYKGLPYVALFSITRPVGGTLTLSEEHQASAWVTYEEMLRYDLTPEVRKAAIRLEARLAGK